MTNKEIGHTVRCLRESKRLSQTDLGERLKISHAAISDLERGKINWTVNKARVVAEYFGVRLSSLLGLDD